MILSVEFSLYNPVACSKEHHFLRGIGLIHVSECLGFSTEHSLKLQEVVRTFPKLTELDTCLLFQLSEVHSMVKSLGTPIQ